MELQEVNLSINDNSILHSINIHWREGEAIAILGANGAGKSSLLNIMSSLIRPDNGKVIFPSNMSIKQWKKCLGIVFSQTFLYESLTAFENLEFYQKLYGQKDTNKIDRILKQVELFHVKNQLVNTFSKGMKQRLSIGRAFIHDPKYLLLDEPFDGLDFNSKNILNNLLEEMKSNKVGYILVSHNSKHAWEVCDRAILIHKGRIVDEESCSEQLYDSFLERYQLLVKGNSHDFY